MSTRRRLALVLAALIALGFIGVVPWILGTMRPRHLTTLEDTLVDLANVAAAMLETEAVLDHDTISRRLAGIDRRDIGVRIYDLPKPAVDCWLVVCDDQGRVLFHGRDPGTVGQDWSQWNDVLRTLRGEYGARTTWTDLGGGREEILHVSAPIGPRDRPRGVLTVCKGAGSVELVIDHARRSVVAVVALAALAVLVVGGAATWWMTRPIARLTAYVEATQAGAREPAPALGPHDLAALGRAFEGMRDALDGKAYVEHYLQSLTHEMKAPVAGIRAAAELLTESDLPEADRARFLANLGRESIRLQDLLDRALALAAIERRRHLDQRDTVALADLVAETVDGVAARSRNLGVDLTVNVAPGLTVTGDRFLLRQALDNLVANALTFAPAGTAITVSADASDGRCRLRVRDHGPGIPAYALPRIFERFYSLPRPGSDRKGSGLGLPFVREVAHLHGGEVTVVNHPDGGVEATLIL